MYFRLWPFVIGLSFQLTFQLQNPFCSIHKSVLLSSIFHPQNPIRFRRIRFKQKRILARILWTSICNLRELLDDVNGHRVSKSLSTANEESFISCFGSGESFDMSVSQISNINLLWEISKRHEIRSWGRTWEGFPHTFHSKVSKIDRSSNWCVLDCRSIG